MSGDWKDILSQLKGNMPEGDDSDVFDSDDGREESRSAEKETIHVVIERKGRRGKTATIAEGFKCNDEKLEELASALKRKLGVGGSARGGEILIQGECKERLIALLKAEGYKVKG